jgi:formylglycine-generating enzyme required for sulfatase activity
MLLDRKAACFHGGVGARARRFRPWLAALACAVAPGCTTPPVAAPIGEALVVVDTDMPVPKLAARLRADFYTTSGTWYATRDLALPSGPDAGVTTSDWPVSFAVTLDPSAAANDVILRLRLYPEGKVRDYLGERYQERPALCDVPGCASTTPSMCCPLVVPPAPAPLDGPRLLDASGNDVTPTSEPEPLLSVDRLLLIHLEQGVVGKAAIVLRGACTGTMADVRSFGALATCVDTENVRVPLTTASLDPDLTIPPSVAGSFEQGYAIPCAVTPRAPTTVGGVPLHDDEACVTGGGFVLGGIDAATGEPTDPLPERAVFVTSFLMDRYEVTVGRYRAALAQGYVPLEDLQTQDPYCTWTSSPGGAEEEPLNCITPENARAFCRYEGGDLPTEAQWEYAATAAGRDFKTHFPWGDGNGQPPSCADVIYARAAGFTCTAASGPANVDAVEHDGGDVTVAAGGALVDLAGNAAELTADSFAVYSSNCWLAATLGDPSCQATATTVASRGAAFESLAPSLLSTTRNVTPLNNYSQDVGFRCVRPATKP